MTLKDQFRTELEKRIARRAMALQAADGDAVAFEQVQLDAALTAVQGMFPDLYEQFAPMQAVTNG